MKTTLRLPDLPRVRAALSWVRARALAHPRVTAGALVVVAVLFWSATAAFAWFTYDVTHNLPGRSEVASIGDMAQATVLYDASDQPVFTIFKEQRIEVPLDRVSPNLIKAVISVEDQRFFDHAGVDVIRILGAFAVNLREGRMAQGGSTITQQLARQSFLTLERTPRRKLKEALLAALIERSYSKQEILQLYLNKVYFGDGFYGVEAASRGFFGKSAAELNVEEAALLAGVIKSPSTWAPTVNLEKAVARRNVVLQTMLDSGAIDRATYERARQADVKLENGLQRDEGFGLYFKEQVRRELVEQFGWERVSAGGLRVYTTIDSRMQLAAEQILEKALTSIEERRGYKHPKRADLLKAGGEVTSSYLQGALVAIDPTNGHVRVMVGGRNFRESRFNRATQARRQPGSAFKPFVFAAAIERGMTPASLITNLDDPVATPEGGWMPEDEHLETPSLTVRTALRTSSNRAAVRVLETVGMRQTMETIDKLQVGNLPRVPSIALGAGEVTVQSLTAAYAAFANGGSVVRPILIRRVEDRDGQVLLETKPQLAPVFSESTAFLMANMLTDVINAGTAYRARAAGFTLPAAGKTGTTNDYVDAWFVGFTPKLVAAVWMGFDQPRTIIANGYGGELAVPAWGEFMKVATKGHKPEWLKRPSNVVGVEVCRMSGRRPASGCGSVEVVSRSGEVQTRSMIYTEYFVRGTEPYDICPLHEGSGFFGRMADLFRGGRTPGPVPAAASPLPERTTGRVEEPVVETAPATTEAEAKPEPEKKKKRGFWSRIFGRRDRDEDEESKDRKEEERRRDERERKPSESDPR
ncbi:MAG TPA: PBP1A family penicillin-binding protein [Vicinamibacterales bacterium]